jgi:hypothetical protein
LCGKRSISITYHNTLVALALIILFLKILKFILKIDLQKKFDLELLKTFLEGMGRKELLGRRIYVCVQFYCFFSWVVNGER